VSEQGKQSFLNKVLSRDGIPELAQKIMALGVIIRQAEGLKRLVSNPDWKYIADVFGEARGMIVQKGQTSSDKDIRYSAFEALNAIDNIDFVIKSKINKGKEALQQHNDLQEKLNEMKRKSA
jgi:hypothetical protein